MPAAAWRRLRLVVLRRDKWACSRCGRHAPLEVHHADGDPANNEPGNLVTFCRACHIAEHKPAVPADVQAWHRLMNP
jgi:5-methylcytosine-specific restriction endonuclease McrA